MEGAQTGKCRIWTLIKALIELGCFIKDSLKFIEFGQINDFNVDLTQFLHLRVQLNEFQYQIDVESLISGSILYTSPDYDIYEIQNHKRERGF